jgi:hypothetical protein
VASAGKSGIILTTQSFFHDSVSHVSDPHRRQTKSNFENLIFHEVRSIPAPESLTQNFKEFLQPIRERVYGNRGFVLAKK